MLNLLRLIAERGAILEDAGIDRGKAEIEIILCHLLDFDRLNLYLHGQQLLNADLVKRMDEIVRRRKARYPLQYILGEAWFYGRRFCVSPEVMVPTPETELLCQSAIRFVEHEGLKCPRILDIGTGSGVISVTLAGELSDCKVVAVDISPEALKVARSNANELKAIDKIEFRQSDFFSAVDENEKFDLILSNPPYISDGEYVELPPEVLADPKISLTSGPQGMDAITAILEQAPPYLASGGRLMMEIGYKQAELVRELTANDNRYCSFVLLSDLNEIDRVVILSCEKQQCRKKA